MALKDDDEESKGDIEDPFYKGRPNLMNDDSYEQSNGFSGGRS